MRCTVSFASGAERHIVKKNEALPISLLCEVVTSSYRAKKMRSVIVASHARQRDRNLCTTDCRVMLRYCFPKAFCAANAPKDVNTKECEYLLQELTEKTYQKFLRMMERLGSEVYRAAKRSCRDSEIRYLINFVPVANSAQVT